MGDLLFNILTDGIKIVLTDNYNIKTLGGIYYRDTKTILGYTKKIKDTKELIWVFLHELGHHVFYHQKYDRFFKFDYLWQAFKNYQNHKYHFDFITEQPKFSLSEFFSEVFALYFINPKSLIQNDKKLFIKLKKTFNNIIIFFNEYNNKLK